MALLAPPLTYDLFFSHFLAETCLIVSLSLSCSAKNGAKKQKRQWQEKKEDVGPRKLRQNSRLFFMTPDRQQHNQPPLFFSTYTP